MMRWLLFQLHWLLGISAGLVLAVMGVTGAMMSFEVEIMAALSHGVATIQAPAGASALSPDQLVARAAAQRPGRKVLSLTLESDPGEAARVSFDLPPGRRGRGESSYIDPYRGQLLGQARGQAFFSTVRRVHRFLALPGDGNGIGRTITGISALALIYFALSGLYLRWPRQPLDWRAWLVLDLRRTGRNLYRALHAVIGGWVLLFYLLSGFTGLWWSYGWYRDGVSYALTGQTIQAEGAERGGAGPKRSTGAMPPADRPGHTAPGDGMARGGRRDGGMARPADAAPPKATIAAPALTPAWAGFQHAAIDRYEEVTIMWPDDGGPLRFRGLLAGARHDRMIDEVEVSPDGRVGKIDRYADRPLGKVLVASVLNLHRGSFFGLPGRIVMLLTSLTMPLFAITGWLLYLGRRKRKRALAALQPVGENACAADAWLIVYASQTGRAQQLARQTAIAFEAAGQPVRLLSLGALGVDQLAAASRALFVVSTYGDGEPPDEARAFQRRTMAAPAQLASLRYAVLALGDREYPDFCEFGRRLDGWLAASGASALCERIDWDGEDALARRQWAQAISRLGASANSADWLPAPYQEWRLQQREVLNPGSPGAPAVHLALTPMDGQMADWRAGDVVEVLPRHSPAQLAPWLALAPPPQHEALAERLASCDLTTTPPSLDALEQLPALRPREYSIASIAGMGRIELLVRQSRRDDGELGLASGWLTAHAPIGAAVALRIRPNPGFHPAALDAPLILVGNGTGLAGLLAHLRQRIAVGAAANWLIFGERSGEHDRFHDEELQRQQQRGVLRLDRIFSRDAGGGYVQRLLERYAEDLRQWVADGAAIYVCGSLHGMAPAVDQALRELLGDSTLEELSRTGRYRRDVY